MMTIPTMNATETARNPESSNIVVEWKNVKTILSQGADESLEKYKAFT
jgi:hypothetical protein